MTATEDGLRKALEQSDAAETHLDALLILRGAVATALAAATPPANPERDAVVELMIDRTRKYMAAEAHCDPATKTHVPGCPKDCW